MQEFIAASPISKEILNSATFLKTLNINAFISGNIGVGKKTLASFILPKAPIYDALDLQTQIAQKEFHPNSNKIIVNDIDKLSNIDSFISWAEQNAILVVATTTKRQLAKKLADFFGLELFIPDLKQRPEDVELLVKKFTKEAMLSLGIEIEPKNISLDFEQNAISLKKSVYFSCVLNNLNKNDIENLLENYIYSNLEGENLYKKFLEFFETPFLKASLKKYKSQLNVSKHLGINRITLRKKLEALKITQK